MLFLYNLSIYSIDACLLKKNLFLLVLRLQILLRLKWNISLRSKVLIALSFIFPTLILNLSEMVFFVSYCPITKASTNYRQRKGGWAQLCVGWAASWYQSPYVMSLSPDWHLNTTTTTLQPPTPAPPVITIVIDCHRPPLASLFSNSYLIIKLVLFLFGGCLKVGLGQRSGLQWREENGSQNSLEEEEGNIKKAMMPSDRFARWLEMSVDCNLLE